MRKRQRKKNEKRRGVWKLPIIVTHKRGFGYDQETADALAIALSYKFKANREEIFKQIVAESLRMLTPVYPKASEILGVIDD